MDTSITKVTSDHAPRGEMGQLYLASGTRVSMRLWQQEESGGEKAFSSRDYETVGFVISGRAELELAGQRITLEPGDSWVVPRGARHRYSILEPLTAIEATSPPAQVHARDESEEVEEAEEEACEGDQCVDEASMESFPASDPPSWTPTRSGTPQREKH